MNYHTFCELQPGDLVVANRGRFKGQMFEVESVDYDEETARVIWSTTNEGFPPDPIPVMDYGRYSIDALY